MSDKRNFSIGIDPGQTGALSIFEQDSAGEWHLNTIFDYASEDILPILREIIVFHNCYSACIELVHSAPGQGVSSTFKFGVNFGWWIGVLEGLGYSYLLVTPQTWQGKLFKSYRSPTGGYIATTKEVSLKVAKQLFNKDADKWFSRKKDHGRSDAALIGWYGILQIQ